MPWLNHPTYLPIRARLVACFQRQKFRFRRLNHVVFLCGGAGSTRRDDLARYLRKTRSDTHVFYADHVWEHLALTKTSTFSALDMEGQLAALADVVIIIVESPGTIAEVGAFALHDALRKKLLTVCSTRYKDEPSFINTGPIRWIDQDSLYGPTVYADFDSILLSATHIDERLQRLPKRSKSQPTLAEVSANPKHLLFLLCDLIAIAGPITSHHAGVLLADILQQAPATDIDSLLGLALALDEVCAREVKGIGTLYFRPPKNDVLRPFQHQKMFSLAVERAKVMGALQRIPQAIDALTCLSA